MSKSKGFRYSLSDIKLLVDEARLTIATCRENIRLAENIIVINDKTIFEQKSMLDKLLHDWEAAKANG